MRLWNGKYIPRDSTEEGTVEFATENPSMYEITKEVFDMKHCDACHSDLQRGWEVEHDQDYNLNFCDRSCANEYYYNNPNTLVDGNTSYTVDEVLSTKILD